MEYLRTLSKLFLNAGLEKEEYRRLLPEIHEENRTLLKLFSRIAVVAFGLLFLVSMLSGGFATANSPTYLACCAGSLVILLCTRFVLPKKPSLVQLFVILFEILLYAFGIHISLLHTDKPAVSAVAFLLVSPLLFYDRPIRLSALITAVVAIFSIIVSRFKQPDTVETDIWNMITFGIVAIVSTVFIMSIKMRTLQQSEQIEYLSQTDLLTGAKNRNHYEKQLHTYPEMCKSNLICVYADVNGLHEMNNSEGHLAGDAMLREVSSALQQYFGPEHTYRIGGDEFIAFRTDTEPDALISDIARLKQELEKKGYHVSIGITVREKAKDRMDMHEIVSEAESSMFADKRDFYRQSGRDRRSRNR